MAISEYACLFCICSPICPRLQQRSQLSFRHPDLPGNDKHVYEPTPGRRMAPSCSLRTRFEFLSSAPMTTKPKHAASTETVARSDRFDVAALRDLAGDKVFARGVDY